MTIDVPIRKESLKKFFRLDKFLKAIKIDIERANFKNYFFISSKYPFLFSKYLSNQRLNRLSNPIPFILLI